MTTRQWRFTLPNGARFVNGPMGDCIVQFPAGWEEAIAESLLNQLSHWSSQDRAQAQPQRAASLGHTVATLPNVDPMPAAQPMTPPLPPMGPIHIGGKTGLPPAQFELLKPPPVPAMTAMQAPSSVIVTVVAMTGPSPAKPNRTRGTNPLMPGYRPPAPKAVPPLVPIPTPAPVIPAIGDPSVQVVSMTSKNHNAVVVTEVGADGMPKRGKMSGKVEVLPQPPIMAPPPIPK